jgi:hypothetical protein
MISRFAGKSATQDGRKLKGPFLGRSNSGEAQKQIAYFEKNRVRMRYATSRRRILYRFERHRGRLQNR